MISNKRILKVLVNKYKQDPDGVLILLWDIDEKRFAYLRNENSIVKGKDLKFVKELTVSKSKKEDKREDFLEIKPVKVIRKEYNFSSIGKIVERILYITKEEILRIHNELVLDFKDLDDPIFPSGLKNEHLLDSALFHPQTAYSSKVKYPTVESAGAALMYSISSNHAFHNGNKRTALVSLLVFLDRHHISLICDEDELFKMSIMVADHKLVSPEYLHGDAEVFELACWIHDNSKIVKKGERPITLKKFKQILSYFECEILSNGKVKRVITVPFFGFLKNKTLTSKRVISEIIAEGDIVDRNLIKSIREDLELDHIHNIDSETFYAMTEFSSSEFIVKYKNLLRRLAKV